MIFMPIVSVKLRMNDSTLLLLITLCESVGLLISPFITSLPGFYAAQEQCDQKLCEKMT
jgi:hypothetical protein